MMALGLLAVVGLVVLSHVLGLAAGYLLGWRAGAMSAAAEGAEVQFPPPIAVNWPLRRGATFGERALDDSTRVAEGPPQRHQP